MPNQHLFLNPLVLSYDVRVSEMMHLIQAVDVGILSVRRIMMINLFQRKEQWLHFPLVVLLGLVPR